MSNFEYLTPQKSLDAISREKADEAQIQNIDLYEAVADLYETAVAVQEINAELQKEIDALKSSAASTSGGTTK